jgi:hypothetical protein
MRSDSGEMMDVLESLVRGEKTRYYVKKEYGEAIQNMTFYNKGPIKLGKGRGECSSV